MSRLGATGMDVTLGDRAVVRGCNLDLAGGALIGLLGPNGAGKSSLLRAMAGLLPPSAGAVALDGRDVQTIPPGHRARRIAYLPQERECRWPISVRDVARLGRPKDAAAVEAALAATDMTALADRPMDRLSGGERARALVARALAVEPAVLLADEPLAGLDPGHQLDLLAMFRARADAGMLVVLVAHDLTLVPRFVDRLVVMAEGVVVADGAPADVLADPATADAYGIGLQPGRAEGGAYAVPLQRRP